MLNHIEIMGRLGRDPELRHTQSGTPVASFSLAVDRDFKDKSTGERITDWIDVVAWRSTGEFVSKYFSKGRMAVCRSGSGRTRRAISAARRRSLPAMCTLPTPSPMTVRAPGRKRRAKKMMILACLPGSIPVGTASQTLRTTTAICRSEQQRRETFASRRTLKIRRMIYASLFIV